MKVMMINNSFASRKFLEAGKSAEVSKADAKALIESGKAVLFKDDGDKGKDKSKDKD